MKNSVPAASRPAAAASIGASESGALATERTMSSCRASPPPNRTSRFVGEVPEERLLGQSRPLRDLRHRGLLEASLAVEGKGRLHEPAARVRFPSGHGPDIGDGSNRWQAVHRLDAARPYRLALEQGPAGSVFHAVADEGVPTREIAEVISRHQNVPAVSIAPDDAGEHFGWIGAFFAVDAPASSALTQERLAWQPTHPGLIADLEQGHYFTQAQPAAA